MLKHSKRLNKSLPKTCKHMYLVARSITERFRQPVSKKSSTSNSLQLLLTVAALIWVPFPGSFVRAKENRRTLQWHSTSETFQACILVRFGKAYLRSRLCFCVARATNVACAVLMDGMPIGLSASSRTGTSFTKVHQV